MKKRKAKSKPPLKKRMDKLDIVFSCPFCGMLSIMASPPDSGQLIALLLKLINPKKTIEIGVFTEYSLLLTALAIPQDGKATIDMDRDTYEMGLPVIKKAGVEHKINFIQSPALSVLDELLEDHENRRSFDFAFVDADKDNYQKYHERLWQLLKVGGIVVYDNTLWNGTVAMPEGSTKEELKPNRLHIVEFNKFLAVDYHFQISQVRLAANYDPTENSITPTQFVYSSPKLAPIEITTVPPISSSIANNSSSAGPTPSKEALLPLTHHLSGKQISKISPPTCKANDVDRSPSTSLINQNPPITAGGDTASLNNSISTTEPQPCLMDGDVLLGTFSSSACTNQPRGNDANHPEPGNTSCLSLRCNEEGNGDLQQSLIDGLNPPPTTNELSATNHSLLSYSNLGDANRRTSPTSYAVQLPNIPSSATEF
ncbi:Caffeoyl-CoA O-methyltransferase [Capsicum annuum]|uniref:caffeoyl-CoA O-methyltransferase n=1 Tax=Capsicum annuum TaxID=4072 RepID=A0A2G2ZMA2_CAPAN|nr:Caffeoyl-CoA O-methyltransferase [Capsicum annuum]